MCNFTTLLEKRKNMKKIELSSENSHLVWVLLILLAYAFSVGMRMYWPMVFASNESMHHNGLLMINTNDGYYYMTGARDFLSHYISENYQRFSPIVSSPGLVILTAYASKLLGLSIDTVSLYLPAIISSLIVIPIILTGRLIGNTLLGFLAALIGSIAWSYYNRTMTGYYDTDMFSVLLQFSIFYSLLHVIYRKDVRGIVVAALLMFAYPYFYPQGMSIIYAMFVLFVLYMFLEYHQFVTAKETKEFSDSAVSLYGAIMFLSVPLMTALPVSLRLLLFALSVGIFALFKKNKRQMLYISLVYLVAFLYFSNIFHIIAVQILSYLSRGVDANGLHFYQTVQTVREAGAIPFSTMAKRISGSQIGVLLSFAGYIILVMRHKPFIIALPLIGIGVLSLWAGLRFTVYAVPVAAISVVYLFFTISKFFENKHLRQAFVFVATLGMLYPNIQHILAYKVPTVFSNREVQDLEQLRKISTDKDYTIAWWDYGFPIWYYSNTNTLIDGAGHSKENFIVSKILQTDSPELAASMSRLEVEMVAGETNASMINALFHDGEKNQIDPEQILSKLESGQYPLPKKTRDIFLYLPYRMMNIFQTVIIFGNMNLMTGKPIRHITFYPTLMTGKKNGLVFFNNGIVFNTQKGEVQVDDKIGQVKNFIITQNTQDGHIHVQSRPYHMNGKYVVVYMKSYGLFVVMDTTIFKSTYIQMFVLGKYDKNLFELVVASPYTRIYKLKR